ncbi:MAG: hypothetical protein NC833_05675 [Candidatus Omnitrophica bacterium]|nr:hypothetical protein [Candidatus Omnitrophota bacterium]
MITGQNTSFKEIYKSLFKIRKGEILLFLIIFSYTFFRNLFFEKISYFYFFILLFEIYLTISVYYGIKKYVYNENFIFSDIFKETLFILPPVLLYHILIGVFLSFIYLIITSAINSIKIYSFFSFFLFFLIILWASIPIFFLLFTIYTPFIIILNKGEFFNSIFKSYQFMRKNFENLIILFFPFLILYLIFFTSFKKYSNIFLLKLFLFILISFLELLTIKLVFLVYKGVKNERNI